MAVGEEVRPRTALEEEFRRFFRTEFPALAGFCAGLVGDTGVGEEIAQEALVRTWGRWRQVHEPRAFAYVVATNLTRRYWRSNARERQLLELLDKPATATGTDLSLRDLVDRLPERLREPVVLHYYADLPVEAIARYLRRPSGTVRQRLHEARQRLARAYQEEDRD